MTPDSEPPLPIDDGPAQKRTGYHVVIPARYDSTRLPGKPLADIAGQPMIVHVAQAAANAGALDVTVATDDERVAEVVVAAGFHAELTRKDHTSGSDRVYEVAARCGWGDQEIVLNVQGDEPLLPPALVQQVGDYMQTQAEVAVCTLREPILDEREMQDPNCVKVVVNAADRALLFSRASIPFQRGDFDRFAEIGDFGQRHIGLYGYRISALRRFVELPPSSLERQESLEQLRLLDNGIDIVALPACEAAPGGVDTPEDLARARALLS